MQPTEPTVQSIFCRALVLALVLACVPGFGPLGHADAGTPETPGAAETPEASKVEIPNAKTPMKGVLTGGQPTEEQLAELAKAGYRTLVNLRTDGENEVSDREAALAESLGMRYVHLPMAGAEGLTEDNATALQEILADDSLYPVVVHCGSGNRVGALFALKSFYFDCHNGEEAVEAGKAAGLTRLEPAVREKLGVEDKNP